MINQEAWDDVSRVLCGGIQPGEVWLRTLARNLASIRRFRPSLYAKVRSALSAFYPEETDLCPNPESGDARALEIFHATQSLRQGGRSVALAGLGDGRVLRAHCRFPPSLILGRQQEVVLIEPDLTRLVIGLGCTDLSGPRGAFEQARIAWYVGPSWVDELSQDLIDEPTRIAPARAETVDLPRPEIDRGLEEVHRRQNAEHARRRERLNSYYEAYDDTQLPDLLSDRPVRRPRALLITSRFSSVLQYSTRDAAHAMRELGWETLVVAEAQMWHSMSPGSVLAAMESHKPDLVLQIDHLRHELKDLVPAKVPFVCWIQDHLDNLTNETAGRSIGERDFVLTGAVYRYVGRYGYPRRQCIDMVKCSRPPELPHSWTTSREDLLYVSHWSQPAESIVAELCVRVRDLAGAVGETVMRECCERMVRAYGQGGSFRTEFEVRRLVRSVLQSHAYNCESSTEDVFVDGLFQRLNQVYYRQQSLEWAAAIADELGLKFGIYGNGWERHPTLRRFARGVVTYGAELEALTRESKILLQVEPYACFSHQRMLDALLAGGFALVRAHPFNHQPILVRQFLDAYVPSGINSVAEAMDALAPPLRDQFQALLGESESIAAMGDVVDVVRGWQRSGLIGDGDVALPGLDEVTFDSKSSLRERIVRFLGDDSARRQIAGAQREAIVSRLTYREALRRALRKIEALLRETCRQSEPVLKEAA